MWRNARGFLLVLLLLAVDWYFDTSFGRSPFTRPMYSTEVACQSLADKQDLCKAVDAAALTPCPAVAANLDSCDEAPPAFAQAPPAFLLPSPDRLYALMALRC